MTDSSASKEYSSQAHKLIDSLMDQIHKPDALLLSLSSLIPSPTTSESASFLSAIPCSNPVYEDWIAKDHILEMVINATLSPAALANIVADEISHKNGIVVHQAKITRDVLKRFHTLSAKSCATPLVLAAASYWGALCSAEDAKNDRVPIGALHYLTFSRPHISFCVSKLSQYMHTTSDSHLVAAKRILRYLSGLLVLVYCFIEGTLIFFVSMLILIQPGLSSLLEAKSKQRDHVAGDARDVGAIKCQSLGMTTIDVKKEYMNVPRPQPNESDPEDRMTTKGLKELKVTTYINKLAIDEKDLILGSIPSELKEKGSSLYTTLTEGKGGLQTLLQSIRDNDPDKVSVGLATSLDTVAELELLQAPGLSFLLPEQYLKYPRLTGRGTVEFTIEKGDGSAFSPQAGGESSNTATIQVVVDGFSAPLTAGNFAKLSLLTIPSRLTVLCLTLENSIDMSKFKVIDGAYNGTKLSCTSQAVLSENSLDNNEGYSIPLEIKPSGQFEPLYKTTLSVQDGELPVLPLSVYGAVAMAHNEDSEEYSSPYQFFFYLYDKRNSGLGGLSFDEGQFSVFGYTTVGRDILPQIKTGDIIRSVKLVEGGDRLILPNEN
ncbi:Peptidyl-prolyl cis-trans isomerase CYP37, chloroplastic, partial [Cucurbita argyrosperma subsp. argyrosperma]